MGNTAKFLSAGVCAALLIAQGSSTPVTYAQAPQAPPAQPSQAPGQPTFRVSVDLVTTDVIVRDLKNDQFIADLKPGEFEVYEDGVKQQIASLVLTHGGRVFNVQTPPPPPVQEGIILPKHRPTNDAAGRVFVVFIDDLHLDFRSTPRTRELIKKMLKLLIHDGDMFGMVSSGESSISEQLTYDRQILESSISRITGGGLRPKEIIQGMQSSQGPTELRHRAHVAFSTAYDLMRNLEKLQNRRKAVIYISSGYDFNPFETSRLEEQAKRMGLGMSGDESGNGQSAVDQLLSDPFVRQQQSSQMLAEGDLVRELAELTRAANRANATMYTIDPRGLVAGQDLDDEVPTQEWNAYVRDTQDSLRVLAEETGGIAVVNQNDFDKALKRIDNETSDYYVLGYYSSNPDPLKRRRRIEVRTTRQGLRVIGRTEYTLRPNVPAGARVN
ncbi:MAG TPA: VWA domain-containing protein [Vicinamibacterales bacterium]|jgi:VWFA-related protein|nr:VWA domain-containing protein [Vicinamibacterales bacterium]